MDEQISDFLKKFAESKHTKEEHKQFLDWLRTAAEDQAKQVFDQYPDILDADVRDPLPLSGLITKIEASLDTIERRPAVRIGIWQGLFHAAAVAAFLAGLVALTIYFTSDGPGKPAVSVVRQKVPGPDKMPKPGGNKALLTLADGRSIVLDSLDNGLLATQTGSRIHKSGDGQVVYSVSTTDRSFSSVDFNTVSTPRGGQYQLTLPDGTKVWLNAESALKFPTVFSGSERRVELTGEAYFEVAKNVKMPFRVSSSKQTVEVLGTHFNINAYADENVTTTTLLEGSVKVFASNSDKSGMLRPGQQSSLADHIRITEVDVQQAIAWKNGYFSFSYENIKSIMPKIARWYDVEVEYKGNMTGDGFAGSVSRFENVSEVLHILELTGSVHFKIEGKKIIVLP